MREFHEPGGLHQYESDAQSLFSVGLCNGGYAIPLGPLSRQLVTMQSGVSVTRSPEA